MKKDNKNVCIYHSVAQMKISNKKSSKRKYKKKSKKKNCKYSDQDIDYINSFKDQKNMTLVKVKKSFKKDKQRSISTSTISKIWKNLY